MITELVSKTVYHPYTLLFLQSYVNRVTIGVPPPKKIQTVPHIMIDPIGRQKGM